MTRTYGRVRSGEGAMSRAGLLLLAAFALAACDAPERTVETLRKSGFTDIHTTGYDAFACGEHDDFSTGFVATNPQGERVTGVVCCGLLKNCTVRF